MSVFSSAYACVPVGLTSVSLNLVFSTVVNPVKKVWLYEDEGETTEMFIEPGDRIRFRVAEEIFEDSKPKMGGEIQDKVIPYKIIAAIDDDGLGPVSWWN